MSSCCACVGEGVRGPSESSTGWLRLAVAGLVAGQSMIFGLAASISPPSGQARLVIHGLLAVSAVVVFLLAGVPILREAVAAAARGRVVIEQLFLAGILGAFGASVDCTLTGYGHIYYEVVAILVAIYTFGRLLGERRRKAAMDAARELGVEFDRCEVIGEDGATRWVSVASVMAGDRVVVRTGLAIPTDGVVEEGTCFVRETALTGEPFPVVKRPGDFVMAGSHAIDGMLTIRASVTGNGRRLDALLAGVRAAQERPSDLQREADRLVAWFLPTVLLLAAGTFVFWTSRESWIAGLFNGLAVILVACPCSMGLATPVGVWSALAELAGRGIFAKDSNLIEQLARVDTVVFDKTGTLGEEELDRVDFVTSAGEDRGVLLGQVAALEASSNHPVARAFRGMAAEPVATTMIAGAGVAGEVGGRRIAVGNIGVVPPGERARAEELSARLLGGGAGSHVVYVVAGDRVVGAALLRERLRDSARDAIASLERMGVACEVMTGDSEASSAVHALPNVHAGLTPDEKAVLVRGLRGSGRRVLFVGDGVNDAPAMSEANASIAIGAASALARESAMGELKSGDLAAVPAAIERSRAALAAIRWNLRFAAAYNLIGMTLAVTGVLHPVAAALLMLASSFTVTWRALAPRERVTRPVKNAEIPWRAVVPAGALALQGPVVVYLGGFHGAIAAGFILLFAGAGVCCGVWLARRPFSPFAEMALGMFSIGGLAMLGGWWADAGFGPVVRAGVCLCGCATSSMGLGLFAKVNWMDVSMLAASFPGMLIERDPRSRWWCWLAGVLGMLAGMEAAAGVMALIPVDAPQGAFFATYAAMMLGMCIGMIGACGLWQRWRAA